MACGETKLVITPAQPIANGTTFKVVVNYTGQPGIRSNPSLNNEGWYKNNSPAGEGAMVTSEPSGTMAWMPLNNQASVKPTYDIHTTVNYDPAAVVDGVDGNRVAIANGRLVSKVVNAPDANFPTTGSRTFNWHSTEPVASYLVENSVGHFDESEYPSTAHDVIYYEFQSSNITAAKKASNKAIMDTAGSDHALPGAAGQRPVPVQRERHHRRHSVGLVRGGDADEDRLRRRQHHRADVRAREHAPVVGRRGLLRPAQVHVLQGGLRRHVGVAPHRQHRRADRRPGGLGRLQDAAFEASITARWATTQKYNTTSTTFWNVAPDNPTSSNLFSTANTYTRPGMSYIALRAILGPDNFRKASTEIQTTYRYGSVVPSDEIKIFHKCMPNQSIGCSNKLDAFFKQWWDTAYTGAPAAGNKPSITGPGLAGGGFYDASGGCSDYGNDQPSTPGGTVPATLGLTIGSSGALGPFIPGVAKDYTSTTTANVISTAGDATLSVADPSSTAPGHLVNGAFSLPTALKAVGTSPAGTSAGAGSVSGAPLTLETWTNPVSNDPVQVLFTQSIGATDALRTGSYSKTLTFTLSTTTP